MALARKGTQRAHPPPLCINGFPKRFPAVPPRACILPAHASSPVLQTREDCGPALAVPYAPPEPPEPPKVPTGEPDPVPGADPMPTFISG